MPTTFSFVGVEAVSITAFEARNLGNLRRPSKVIAILVLGIYLPYAFAEAIGVKWNSPRLPELYRDPLLPQNITGKVHLPSSVVEAQNVHSGAIANFLEGFIIYAAFSTSNASLYVASRILYGSVVQAGGDSKWLKRLSREWHSGVPRWCVLISGLMFIWIPLSQLIDNRSTENVRTFLVVVVSQKLIKSS